MRTLAKLGAVAFLPLLGASAALACATNAAEDGEASPPPAPDAANTSAGDAGESPDADPIDAGPCSPSGLCTVPVPFDTQVNVASISGSGPTDVWAVGSNRTILHYDGAAWVKADSIKADASPYTLRSVWVGGATDVWITDGPVLRHTTGWKGPSATEWTSFVLADVDAGAVPSAITGKDGRVFISRQVFYMGVERNPRLVTCAGWNDTGLVEPQYLNSDLHLGYRTEGFWSVAMTRADEAWAISIASIDRTDRTLPEDLPGNRVARAFLAEGDAGSSEADAGPSWQIEEHDTRTKRNLYGVWGNEEVVWLVGEGGVLRRMTHTRVPTRVFEPVPSPVTTDLRGVYGFSADDIWAVGDGATVVHWDGTVWTKVGTPFDGAKVKPRLFAVWGSGPKDVWIGGNGVMLHLEGKP
ncbi:MAG: hypothetical protein K0S65_379 [Labilithrix sp.]|nr:hypothetical protein [Labilithrix sp.]